MERRPMQSSDDGVESLLEDVRDLLQNSTIHTEEEPEEKPEEEPEEEWEEEPRDEEGTEESFETTMEEAVPVPKEPTPLTYYQQSKPAYQNALRKLYDDQREQERKEREQRRMEQEKEMQQQNPSGKRVRREENYAEWLYQQGTNREADETQPPVTARSRQTARPKGKKKKGGFGRVLLVLLLLLTAAFAVFHFILARQPVDETNEALRKKGCATVLLAGTDESGLRTDTMMLLHIDRQGKVMHLVSIPRDTLIYCEYSVPKINSAYGWASGGEDGMEQLMTRVEEIIGFRPDGYLLVNFDVFASLVDHMGGVNFEVPTEMHYSDPSQNLYIDLQQGMQHLDGEAALQVARFRSGYADQDLGRTATQRELLKAAFKQWSSPGKLLRVPGAMKLLQENTLTDLTSGELLWLGESVILCGTDDMTNAILPGTAQYIAGGSYYVLNPQSVAEMVNELCNPYEEGVSAQELSIRVG